MQLTIVVNSRRSGAEMPLSAAMETSVAAPIEVAAVADLPLPLECRDFHFNSDGWANKTWVDGSGR